MEIPDLKDVLRSAFRIRTWLPLFAAAAMVEGFGGTVEAQIGTEEARPRITVPRIERAPRLRRE